MKALLHSLTALALAVPAMAGGQTAAVSITPEFKAAVQQYDIVQNYSDGMAAVCRGGNWGYIDAQGREVVPCQFSRVFDLDNERDDYGFFRDNGYIRNYHEGMVAVAKETSGAKANYDRQLKWGFMDRSGRLVVDYIYDNVYDFSEGLAYVMSEDFTGFIDKAGQRVINTTGKYQPANDGQGCAFRSGRACMMLASDDGDVKYGFINRQGGVAIPFVYADAHSFSEGVAAVAVEDTLLQDNSEATYPFRYQFVDTAGAVVLNLRFGTKPGDFSDSLASVTVDGLSYGFINHSGEQVIASTYFTTDVDMTKNMMPFSEGYSLAGLEQPLPSVADGKKKKNDADDADQQPTVSSFKLIARDGTLGQTVVSGPVSGGYALHCDSNGKYGFVKPDGTVAIPCRYDYAAPCAGGEVLPDSYHFTPEGVAAVRFGGKWGYVDLQGRDTFGN